MEEHARPRRRVRSLIEAQELVAAWKASGETNKEAWCRTQGIRRSALLSCLYRVEEREAAPPGFIEVKPAAIPSAPTAVALPMSLVLDLGHGMRVTGLFATDLVALVHALRQSPA